jgi:hypothetical protein
MATTAFTLKIEGCTEDEAIKFISWFMSLIDPDSGITLDYRMIDSDQRSLWVIEVPVAPGHGMDEIRVGPFISSQEARKWATETYGDKGDLMSVIPLYRPDWTPAPKTTA